MTTHQQACERVAALFASRWLRGYVRWKLASDSLFPLAYEFFRDRREPIFDVGCGVGLLAFYLRERGVSQVIKGVDIDERKIRRAVAAAAEGGYTGVDFRALDVSHELPAARGNVAVFDILHYLVPEVQQRLLCQLASRVVPGGLLLLRDCPRDGSARYRATYLAERFAQMIAWNWSAPLHFATSDFIKRAFDETEFEHEERTAWDRTPFNNRLFMFRRRQSPAVPATE